MRRGRKRGSSIGTRDCRCSLTNYSRGEGSRLFSRGPRARHSPFFPRRPSSPRLAPRPPPLNNFLFTKAGKKRWTDSPSIILGPVFWRFADGSLFLVPRWLWCINREEAAVTRVRNRFVITRTPRRIEHFRDLTYETHVGKFWILERFDPTSSSSLNASLMLDAEECNRFFFPLLEYPLVRKSFGGILSREEDDS